MTHTTTPPTPDTEEAREDRAEAAARRDEREAAHTPARSAVSEAAGPAGGTAAAAGTGHTALVPEEQRRRFHSRWDDIQAGFIDNPRESVAKADALVRDATNALHDLFERDRRQLEGVWDRGEDVSTEDLRVTLQRYRSFFERLLAL